MAALVFGPGAAQWVWLRRREHVLDQRLRVLEARHAELNAEQQRMASDPVYAEGVIRSTLKLSKPGELVVRVDDSSSR